MCSGDNINQNTNSEPKPNLSQYLTRDRWATGLLLSRIFTVVCGLCAALPIFPGTTHPAVWYYRAHTGAALTSFMRLVQIVKDENIIIRFDRLTLSLILSKDVAHYLIFSVLFLTSNTVTLSMIPVLLFALLHSSSFICKMLDSVSINLGLMRKLLNKVIENQLFLLQVISLNEIMLMPVVIISALSGAGNIFSPFVYYRFLSMRYSSIRNPYSKNMFLQLRLTVEQLASSSSCPRLVSNLILKGRDFVSRLAPSS